MKRSQLIKEVNYFFSRSSGSGGQNVNKVNTKVELRFDLWSSTGLTDTEKQVISVKLKNKINNQGELILTSQRYRSQVKNREFVTERFILLIQYSLIPKKIRKATSPTMAAREKRLREKKLISLLKQQRQRKN